MRFLPLLLISLIFFPACATRQYARNSLSGSGRALIDKKLPPAQARREAIQIAEVRARDQLMLQVLKMKMADGRTLEEAAIKDPYVQGTVQDAVRAGHVESDRKVTSEEVQLAVRMEMGPIQKLLRDYPKMGR
jgi:hypothetical protein